MEIKGNGYKVSRVTGDLKLKVGNKKDGSFMKL